MTPQNWLITGGAGYIGAHVADEFIKNGKNVIIYDSLSQGLVSRVDYLRAAYKVEIPLISADIRDTDTFAKTLERYKPYGIIHTAALKAVSESIEKSDEYYEVNLHATTKMLALAASHDIHHFIFSSTAAVYGAPDNSNPVKEEDDKNPISPYGASKLAAEEEVNKFLALPNNLGTSLRFFNVIGTAAPELMDNSVDNLVPIVINKLKAGQPPVIYGNDYPTSDGTCVRDYVDVRDIARVHLAVADSKKTLPHAVNVGTGRGVSVLDVIKLVCTSAERNDAIAITLDRRPGDSASLWADVTLLRNLIGLTASYSIEESVRSLF